MARNPKRQESDGRWRKVPDGPCAWLPGWEIVYDHSDSNDPHAIVRQGEGAATVYALTCPQHATHTTIPTLIAEREIRRRGRAAWCQDCG